jgi:hypothetical protein
VKLRPAHGGHGIGTVTISGRQGFERVRVDARLTPSRRGETYEIWLYESHEDAVSLGHRRAGRSERLKFAADLPMPLEAYRYVDISRERVRGSDSHSGKSVLRARISDLCR